MSNQVSTTKKWYQYLQIKKTLIDQSSPFEFKLVDFRTVGLVFAFSAIVIPFIINIIFSYLFNHSTYALLGSNVLSWIVSGFGCYWVLQRTYAQAVRTSAIAFYYFYYIPNLVSIVAGLILGAFTLSDQQMVTANLTVSLLSAIICITVIAVTSPYVFKKIKLTLKYHYWLVLIVVVIAIIVVAGVGLLFSFIQQQITSSTSTNQENLIAGLDKWWNVVLLALYSIIAAPIIEELACRHGIFSFVGHPGYGFLFSSLYFAGMHVLGAGDWEHLVGYIGPALALSALFLIVRGNVTFNILTHAGYNMITFILLFAWPAVT